MLLSNVRKTNQGFTLIELLIILLIVGILSAFAGPSFLGLLNRGKVNNAVAQVQGALQEAQREAIRKSRNCTVVMTVGSSATLKSPSEDTNNNGLLDVAAGEDINGNETLDKNNCLLTGPRTLPNNVNMSTNVTGSPIQITFNIQGNTKFLPNETGTIVLYESNGSSLGKKCVAISQGIGIIRSGAYDSVNATCNQKPFVF